MNWDLTEIIDVKEYHQFLEKTKNNICELGEIISNGIAKKSLNTREVLQIINKIEIITEKLNRLYGYATLTEEKNQKDQKSAYLKSLSKEAISHFEDTIRPFSHWFKGLNSDYKLSEEEAHKLTKQMGNLEYHYIRVRELAKRTMNEREEEIISKKDMNLLETVKDLRGQIETKQSYTYTDPISNKKRRYNNSSLLLKNIYSQDRLIRENTYKSLFKPYIDNIKSYFSIYEAVVKDWVQESKWRKYESSIQIRNEQNDIDDAIVENLIASVEKNRDIFQKFFKLKAKYLGLEQLSRYDIYAPVIIKEETEYDYDYAIKTVFNVLNNFDKEFASNAKRVIDEKHIDAKPLKNKSNGAFCATISPKLSPYILLNYTGRKRDVLVLAHELGHAIHSLFAKELPPSVLEAPLILAETASTLSEMLVFDYLYSNEKDIEVKKQMLFDKITDSYATICRQAYFTKFEVEAHKLISSGIEIEKLNDVYLNNLLEQFGEAVTVDNIFKYEWSYIPHIVNSPFYCYAYAFGNLLALTIFNIYKTQNKNFINNIKDILKAGGSEKPSKLLLNNGIRIDDPNFWEGGFLIIEGWVKELMRISS